MNSLGNLLAGLVPIVVLLCAFHFEMWRRKRAGDRTPHRESLLREPGHTLRLQVDEKLETLLRWFAIAVGGGLLCGTLVSEISVASISAAALGVLLASWGTFMGWRTLTAAGQLKLGFMGERVVAEHLQPLVSEGYHLFHDIPADGIGNIDHVAVGPAGVFTIETKTRAEKPGKNGENDHQIYYDGKELRFPSGTDRDAITQARRNAEWLGKELTQALGNAVKAQPILVFPGWFATTTTRSDLKVLNPLQVPHFVRAARLVLDDDMIKRIAEELDQRCRDVVF